MSGGVFFNHCYGCSWNWVNVYSLPPALFMFCVLSNKIFRSEIASKKCEIGKGILAVSQPILEHFSMWWVSSLKFSLCFLAGAPGRCLQLLTFPFSDPFCLTALYLSAFTPDLCRGICLTQVCKSGLIMLSNWQIFKNTYKKLYISGIFMRVGVEKWVIHPNQCLVDHISCALFLNISLSFIGWMCSMCQFIEVQFIRIPCSSFLDTPWLRFLLTTPCWKVGVHGEQ